MSCSPRHGSTGSIISIYGLICGMAVMAISLLLFL